MDRVLSACHSLLTGECAPPYDALTRIVDRITTIDADAAGRLITNVGIPPGPLRRLEGLISHTDVTPPTLVQIGVMLDSVQPPDLERRVTEGVGNIMRQAFRVEAPLYYGQDDRDVEDTRHIWLVANHHHGLELIRGCRETVLGCFRNLNDSAVTPAPTQWPGWFGREAMFHEASSYMRRVASEEIWEYSYSYLRARALRIAVELRQQWGTQCRSISEAHIESELLAPRGIGGAFRLKQAADGTVVVLLSQRKRAMPYATLECPTSEPTGGYTPMFRCTPTGF